MAWYDTVKSWFTPESTQPTDLGYDVPLKYQYPTTGFEYESPSIEYQYPSLEPWETEPLPQPEYGGSLWDSFKSTAKGAYEEAKELAPNLMSFYTKIQEIKKPADNNALVLRESARGEIPRYDYRMSTPYQRSSSGTQPARASFPGGLSMPLILIGAGLIFFMLKKR